MQRNMTIDYTVERLRLKQTVENVEVQQTFTSLTVTKRRGYK